MENVKLFEEKRAELCQVQPTVPIRVFGGVGGKKSNFWSIHVGELLSFFKFSFIVDF